MSDSKNDRKHLTQHEVDKLLAAVKGSRNPERDRCLLFMMGLPRKTENKAR